MISDLLAIFYGMSILLTVCLRELFDFLSVLPVNRFIGCLMTEEYDGGSYIFFIRVLADFCSENWFYELNLDDGHKGRPDIGFS